MKRLLWLLILCLCLTSLFCLLTSCNDNDNGGTAAGTGTTTAAATTEAVTATAASTAATSTAAVSTAEATTAAASTAEVTTAAVTTAAVTTAAVTTAAVTTAAVTTAAPVTTVAATTAAVTTAAPPASFQPYKYTNNIGDYVTLGKYKGITSSSADSAKQREEIWMTVIANAQIKAYPKDKTDEYAAAMTKHFTSLAAASGNSLAEFLLAEYGMSEKDFASEAEAFAKTCVSEELVVFAISEAEGISLDNECYNAGAAALLKQHDCAGIAELEEKYGRESIIRLIMKNKIMDLVANS